jgi:hypothetical protein
VLDDALSLALSQRRSRGDGANSDAKSWSPAWVLDHIARKSVTKLRGEAKEVKRRLVFDVREGAPMNKIRRGRLSSTTEGVRRMCSGGKKLSGNWGRSIRSTLVVPTGRTG